MDDVNDIPISALEHYSFCRRQFGLIHLERLWDENHMTIQGSMAHERVDQEITRHERGSEIWRAVPLWNRALNLYGRADVVERLTDGAIVPVEYKRGGRKPCIHEKIQLCAQALCLEAMLLVPVLEGALYHVKTKRRLAVAIDEDLRAATSQVIARVQECFDSGIVPPAIHDSRCDDCSLDHVCLPAAAALISGHSPLEFVCGRADISQWAEDE